VETRIAFHATRPIAASTVLGYPWLGLESHLLMFC
jgi:hypothetical protein